MEITLDNVALVDSEAALRASHAFGALQTGTKQLDDLLAPAFDQAKGTAKKVPGLPATGGILPGMLHLIAGPQRLLSRVLMRTAVMALLPPEQGGVNASRVFYAEFNNDFDPYFVSHVAMEKALTPARVLDRVEIARGFTWDQAVENVARLLPDKVAAEARPVVIVSGLTSLFDPRDRSHFDGLREMLAGVKRCLRTPPVFLLASTPIADGSVFKPRGGHLLYHVAACMFAVSEPRETRSGRRVNEWVLVRHPALPERTIQCWSDPPAPKHVPGRKGRARQDAMLATRTLDDFVTGDRLAKKQW
jgi:hypothetical protein